MERLFDHVMSERERLVNDVPPPSDATCLPLILCIRSNGAFPVLFYYFIFFIFGSLPTSQLNIQVSLWSCYVPKYGSLLNLLYCVIHSLFITVSCFIHLLHWFIFSLSFVRVGFTPNKHFDWLHLCTVYTSESSEWVMENILIFYRKRKGRESVCKNAQKCLFFLNDFWQKRRDNRTINTATQD